MFAQNFPGMELIPLMILSTVVGLAAGSVACIWAAWNPRSLGAWWAIVVGAVCGVGMPTLVFLRMGGKGFAWVGYLGLAAPLAPALLAFLLVALAGPEPPARGAAAPDGKPVPPTWRDRVAIGLLLCVRISVAVVGAAPGIYIVSWFCIIPMNHPSPVHRIEEGMTRDEVRALLGEPREREGGDSHWIYDRDPLGLKRYGVSFDDQGRVDDFWDSDDL